MISFFNTEKNHKRIGPLDIILLFRSGLIQLLPANTKKVYYSLEFFIHLNLTRYGWICFTEVLSVFFFMKQETMWLSDFAFLEKHELHNGWTLGIFEMSQVYFELWQPRNLFHSWALETCFFMSYLFENRDSHFEHL